jgi:DNA-3-methyladenine glycosylase II
VSVLTFERPLPEPFDVDRVLNAVRSSSFGTPYTFVGPETVRRLLHRADQPVAVDFAFSRSERRIRATVVAGSTLGTDDLTRLTHHLWGLPDDLTGFYAAFGDDPILGPLIARFAGLRLIRAADLYEALISAILGQQISVASAQSIRRRLMAGLGDRLSVDGAEFVGYPSPARLLEAGPDGLQALGITRQKSRYLLAVAERAAGGALDEDRFADLDDVKAIATLCAIPGVGRWTAEVALIYGLGRLDLFFAGDLALQVALQHLLGRSDRPGEGEVRHLGERWAGWRSYAALYLLMTLKAKGSE